MLSQRHRNKFLGSPRTNAYANELIVHHKILIYLSKSALRRTLANAGKLIIKGWLQTWFVHMRNPWRLWRDAGASGFFTLNIIVGGNVLTALALPLLFYVSLVHLLSGPVAGVPARFLTEWPSPLYFLAIVSGYFSTVVVSLLGFARRGRLRRGWILAR